MDNGKGRWKTLFRNFILTWLYINGSAVIARNIERYDTAYECEGKILKIECREGELIHLIRANYGRFSITICNEHGNTDWSVNCMSPKSFRVLYNKCNQQQNCSIVASTSQFGDPCPNTLKYLEAHYQCISALTTTTTTRPSPPWVLTSQPSFWTTNTLNNSDMTRFSLRITTAISQSTPKTFSSVAPTNTLRPTIINGWTDEESIKKEILEQGIVENDKKEKMFTTIKSSKSVIPTAVHETTVMPIMPSQQQKFQHFSTSTITPWKISHKMPAEIGTEGSVCPGEHARKLNWNTTQLGAVAVQSCPAGAHGLARWQCVSVKSDVKVNSAKWQRGTPDLSECRSVWLSSLEKRVQEGELVLGISSDLSQVTNNSRELYGGDMLITTKILKNMAERMAKDIGMYQDPRQREASVAELLQGAVTTGSNLLDKAQSASWNDLSHEEQMLVATSLLIGLEENAFLLADSLAYEKNVLHERRNILMEVRVLEAHNLKTGVEIFPQEAIKRDQWTKLHDRIELTRPALLTNAKNGFGKNDGFIRLVFMAFDRLEEILQPEPEAVKSYSINEKRERSKPSSDFFRQSNVTQILNSKVISASLGKGKHVQLTEPVRLYFQHLVSENVTNPRCVFWDYTMSGWSEEGCITRNSNETHTVCECNHLTNFAVLMDVHAIKLDMRHQMALEVITYIGCIISVICLVLAIMTFQLFHGLKSDRTTIHKNLCICLLIAEILFICGIGQTSQKIICGIVAGLLHFFFLCAFAWMFLEGFQLYVMLIEIFEVEKSRLRWYYFVAYGIPLLVVSISCVIDPFSYGTDRHCWLRADNYFIFSFVGPVILVILANLVFLSMAIYMMCRHANTTVSMKSKEHSRLASARAWLRGAIVLVFLLGLTWTFGLLYLNQETVVMAYIFTVLNSLQGLFIFVFHCIQNEKVRKEYRKFIRRHSWLPKCLRCSKSSPNPTGTSGISGAGTVTNGAGGANKDYTSHNTSSNPSAPMTDSSGLSPHTVNSNNIFFKSCPQDSSHGSSGQDSNSQIMNSASDCGRHKNFHNTMTLQGYSSKARDRRLLSELEIGFRATTGRRASSPYNHTYTEIHEARHHQHHHYQLKPNPQLGFVQDDPVYEEIERASSGFFINNPEAAQVSDMSDEDGRRQSDMSRQSSRSYGDHRPLIPYSPATERGLESTWALEKLRRQHQQQPRQLEFLEQQQQIPQQQCQQQQTLRPQKDHTRTVAVLDGQTVVCHLQPQAELYVARGLVQPTYSEC